MAQKFQLRVARPDGNVFTDGPRLMTLDSTVNMLKLNAEVYGTASVVTGATPTYITVNHNLGYRPIVQFFFEHPVNNRWHFAPASATSTWQLLGGWEHVNSNTVRFFLYDGSPAMTSSPTNINYKYYIQVDPEEDAWFG